MASSSSSSSLFLLLCFSTLSLVSSSSSISLLLPVTKDDSTLQYFTTLSSGTPSVPTNLVLDLGGSLPCFDCASRHTPSSSLRTIPHRSVQCLTHLTQTSHTWLKTLADVDQHHPCQILPENTITGRKSTEAELVEDLVQLEDAKETQIPLLFTCSPTLPLNGLARTASGMVGFGRSRSSFSSQFFNSFNAQRKITLCLSSSSGVVLLGSSLAYESEILRSLTFTPLISESPSQEHLISVNSIRIGGRRVSFNTPSEDGRSRGAILSSVVPYTTMQSSVYANFESAYLRAAEAMNMTRVSPVGQFGLCFSSGGVGTSPVGPDVPVIELVLQSEMVKWGIYGRNSMVRVNSDVMCLGFLDGGLNQRNPIVIGGYQLEDVLVQFDFETSMVGFSSSLLMRQSSCSNFRFGSATAQSA